MKIKIMTIIAGVGQDVLVLIFEYIPDDCMTFGVLRHVSKEIRRILSENFSKTRSWKIKIQQLLRHHEVLKWALIKQNGVPHLRLNVLFNYLIPFSDGKMDILLWALYEAGCSYNWNESYQSTLKIDHLELFKWLHEIKNPEEQLSFYGPLEACRHGAIKILDCMMMRKYKYNIHPQFCGYVACERNQFETLKFIFSHFHKEIELNTSWTYAAAWRGNIEMFKWLVEKGCDVSTPFITKVAAQHGHVEILKYAHEINLPHWHPETAIEAVRYGKLDALKFIVENKPSLFNLEECISFAEICVQQNILSYLLTLVQP